MISDNEINALISLLDDPDEEVYEHVIGKLKSYGPEIIPSLENVWESSFNPNLQNRIEKLIHLIQFDSLCQEMKQWAMDGGDDLLQGMITVSKYQYPDIDEQKISRQLDKIKQSIWLEFNYNLTPIEQINVFNQIFYKKHGFSGNTANIQDPQNAYINSVLDNHKGNTISLGIIYLIIAQELEMPVYGVNLPQHFILIYMKDTMPDLQETDLKNNVLFYINTFNKGMPFSRNEINLYLKKLNMESSSEYYLPCNNITIIRELVHSLINSFEELGSIEKVNELKRLLESLS